MTNTTWSTTDKSSITLTGGNLIATGTSSTNGVRSTDRLISGKYYWETTFTTLSNTNTDVGIASANVSLVFNLSGNTTGVVSIYKSGVIWAGGSGPGTNVGTLGARASGDIIGIALDIDAQLVWFRVAPSGNWNGSATADPITGVGGISIARQLGGMAIYAIASPAGSDVFTANFGDTAFSGTVPTGFTSGFPTGTPAIRADVTQLATEQWAQGTPVAQISQVAVEQWGAGTGGIRAIVSTVAVEQWAVVASTGRKRRRVAVAT